MNPEAAKVLPIVIYIFVLVITTIYWWTETEDRKAQPFTTALVFGMLWPLHLMLRIPGALSEWYQVVRKE